jgi:hypothetical protein
VSCGFSLENRLDKREKRTHWVLQTEYLFIRVRFNTSSHTIMISYPLIHFPPINLWSAPSLQKTGEKLRQTPQAQPDRVGGIYPSSPQRYAQVAHRNGTTLRTGCPQRYKQDANRICTAT